MDFIETNYLREDEGLQSLPLYLFKNYAQLYHFVVIKLYHFVAIKAQ